MKLLVVFLAVIPAIVFGQVKVKNKPRPFDEGYVIYGDTRGFEGGLVQGPEKKRGLEKFNFSKSTSGVIHEIRAEQAEVLGFGFQHGAVYHAVEFTRDSIHGRFFVKVLVQGNLSLFDDNGALILRPASRLGFELSSSNYRDELQSATVSCPAASPMAQSLRFDPLVLTDFVKGYNKCLAMGPGTFDPFDGNRLLMGIQAGMEFSKLEIAATSTLPEFTVVEHKRLFFGALFLLPYSRSNALELGAIFKPRVFVGHAASGSKVYELTISYDEVLIPISFRHTFFQKKSTSIQGSAGVAVPILINPVSRLATESENSGVVTTSVSHPFTGVTRYVQFNLGFGAVFEIQPRQRLLIHNTFSYAPSSLNSSAGDVGGKLLGYSLTFGYTFR